MISKATRAAALLLPTLVVPAAVLATALPAGAATSGSMCEVNGNQYCLNTANFSLYTPVTESGSGARTITVVPSGGSYKLQFKGDTSMCVAAANNGIDVEVKACNDDGVLWSQDGQMWVNNEFSSQRGENVYLSGQNKAGSQYLISAATTGSGLLQKFTFR